jgi:uncharacterized membrane protein (DUF106 family)
MYIPVWYWLEFLSGKLDMEALIILLQILKSRLYNTFYSGITLQYSDHVFNLLWCMLI